MAIETSDRLAVLGGFIDAAPAEAHGTLHASHRLCSAIARTRRYRTIDVFRETIEGGQAQVALPPGVDGRVLERTRLIEAAGTYHAIYVANGEQLSYPPYVLRAEDDLAPVVAEIGTTHNVRQWTNLFLSACAGTIRRTDGLIFKARFAEGTFRRVWSDWNGREMGPIPFPTATVIPNGVDLVANARNEGLRHATRRELGLPSDAVAFLSFSRLAPVTKGDYRALLFLWRQVVEQWPQAILVLAGRVLDRTFMLHLSTTARQAGLANNLIIVGDPYDVWPDARERLMSAADAFVHLSTGIEEVSSNSTLEAMAFGLPIIASDWAGQPENVADGDNGFLIPAYLGEPPAALQRMMLARSQSQTNGDLGRCVGCDGAAFVRAVGTLVDQETIRLEMGRRSRLRAEELFGLDYVASRRVAFMDELAAEARQSASVRRKDCRDLVDLRAVLWSMSKRPLQGNDMVSIGRMEGFSWLRDVRPLASDRSIVPAVHFILRQYAPITVDDLSRRVEELLTGDGASAQGQRPPSEVWKACTRTLVRLISYGVVAVVTGQRSSSELDDIHLRGNQ